MGLTESEITVRPRRRLSSAIAKATRYPASFIGWAIVPESRMACSIESMRTYVAPSWLDSSLAIVVFPVPDSPPKMISIGGRRSGAYVLKFPITRFYLESELFWKIGCRILSRPWQLGGDSQGHKSSGWSW